MDTGFSASVSGAQAAATKLAVASNNIANVNSTKKVENGVEKDELFVPRSVIDVSNAPGSGVKSVISPVKPVSFLQTNAPTSTTNDNITALTQTNVDLSKETVNQIEAKNAYKANLVALEAKNKTIEQTLDIIS